ncbi:ATP-binding protein [Actinoplanes sp. TRM 88003]|uniref:ATP-binding protein n=1 Tax=Paractinoplanes aksuensis TaxID=2939490 RepID=A0ABT1DXL5_9ACTN|nr:ATP-binding protein [Actinoplanes aksuensis]MCO8275505.1 ATP-binding protein [Actinoplanes aksuensis]
MALFGRNADQRALRLFAERAGHDGGALVLTGEPGSGRTSLLDDLARTRTADGAWVLRGAGVPGTVPSDYADLDRLIAPLYEHLPELPSHLRESLSIAVGLAVGPAPSELSVGTALTMLLRHAARSRPLLIVVDDVQLWDQASRALLDFAGRRLDHSRVGLLVALPTTHRLDSGLAALPAHQLDPLSADASEAMLRSTAGGLADGVHRRVLADAAGCPLGLAELPWALSAEQRAGRESLPPVLPVTTRLTAGYAPMIGRLSPGPRNLLLLAALEGTGDLRPLGRAAGGTDILAELAAVEGAGLIRIEGAGRLRFSSPLVALTVVALAGAVELRRAHHAVAEALAELDPARAVRHLAQTALHPDETLARRLAEAAGHSLNGGNLDLAVDLWMRAAELTPAPETRQARRHAAAAVRVTALADPDGARELIRTDSGHSPAALVQAIIDVRTARRDDSGLADAHEQLRSALTAHHSVVADHLLAGAAATETLAAWYLGCGERAPADRSGPVDLLSGAFPQFGECDPFSSEDVDRALRQMYRTHDPVVAAQASLGLAYLDRLSESHDVLRRLVGAGSGLAAASALPVIASWCLADWPTGRWSEIDELTSDYDRLAAQHGAVDLLSPLPHLARGLLAAARGDRAQVRAVAADLTGPARRRAGIGPLLAHHVSGLLALGDGRFEVAYHHLAHLTTGASASHRSWATLDVVEAAWHSGHHDAARAAVDALSGLPATRVSERLAWLVRAGRAVVGGPEAGPLFAAVVGTPAAQRWPFDLARMHLAYGEHLRIHRDAGTAQFHLHQAARIFQRLGTPSWHGRAHQLVRAKPGDSPHGARSPQPVG